jgi:hypothetical protein
MELKPYRSFEVTLTITQRVHYLVEARTPEEAEDTAEEWALEGEAGINDGLPDILIEDTLPVEELTSDEIFTPHGAPHNYD